MKWRKIEVADETAERLKLINPDSADEAIKELLFQVEQYDRLERKVAHGCADALCSECE